MTIDRTRTWLAFLASAMVLSACDRPECRNTNPVFEQHSPYSNMYKNELIAQLERIAPDEVRYWIDTYEGSDGKFFLHFFVQGGVLCAKAVLTIPPEQAKRLHEKKGSWTHGYGYSGAEIIGLRYDVVQDAEKIELVLQGWDRMID